MTLNRYGHHRTKWGQASALSWMASRSLRGPPRRTSSYAGWWCFGAGTNTNTLLPSSDGWCGELDNVAIYGSPLSPARIAAHYAGLSHHLPGQQQAAATKSSRERTAVHHGRWKHGSFVRCEGSRLTTITQLRLGQADSGMPDGRYRCAWSGNWVEAVIDSQVRTDKNAGGCREPAHSRSTVTDVWLDLGVVHEDRRFGMLGHGGTDRSEQKAGKATVATAAHDNQVHCTAAFNEELGGLALGYLAMHEARNLTAEGGLKCLAGGVFSDRPGIKFVGERLSIGGRRPMPGGECGDLTIAGELHRVAQRRHGVRRPIKPR